jgi:Na+/phosphate symporter
MKEKQIIFNPFRMLSPRFNKEALSLTELHKEEVTPESTLEEGMLITISKLIEMTQLLRKCVISEAHCRMDQCQLLGDQVQEQEGVLTKALIASEVKGDFLKNVIRFPYRLERVGDMLGTILDCCRIKAAKSIPFSDKAYQELEKLFSVTITMLTNLRDAFRTPNQIILDAIISDANMVATLVEEFKLAHWERLEAGFCHVEASHIYRVILDAFKSMEEYMKKMAITLSEFPETPAT